MLLPEPYTTLLAKSYSGEGIVDIERDIMDAINEADIPVDKWNIANGTFHVVLTFEEYTQ
jgi:hypothetical protein